MNSIKHEHACKVLSIIFAFSASPFTAALSGSGMAGGMGGMGSGVFQHVNFINMGRDVTKPVFGVSDKARRKPVSSATETS